MVSPSEVTAIIPVCEKAESISQFFHAYHEAIISSGKTVQFIYVVTPSFPEVLEELVTLKNEGHPISIIHMARNFGEATAIQMAFRYARSPVILTLPAYPQIDPAAVPQLLENLGNNDMVISRRWPRLDGSFNQLQTKTFRLLLKPFFDADFKDIGCSGRAFKRQVLEEITLYGDQHRFLPLLAHQQGFKIKEIDALQASGNRAKRVYSPGTYLRRVLDLITIIFLTKFNKKPLRFFGLFGTSSLFIGIAGLLYMLVERMAFHQPMADRPLLVLFSLFIVMGVQLTAIGLVGESIIFTHAKDLKEYTIRRIIN